MAIQITRVGEGWNAPGYRDPILHFITAEGEISVQLTPRAFVELIDILAGQQHTIDRNGEKAIDHETYPLAPRYQLTPKF